MSGALLVVMFLGAAIAAAVAETKHRSVIGWLIAGAMFPLIAVIAVCCLPPSTPNDARGGA